MTAFRVEMQKKCSFEHAMDLTGFGIYNMAMLITCCLLILAMYLDVFGLSVAIPAVACDLELNTSQQGLLTAMPLIGALVGVWFAVVTRLGRRVGDRNAVITQTTGLKYLGCCSVLLLSTLVWCVLLVTSYILTAVTGVMLSSYAWGLCADTLGRRTTVLLAMPVGSVFNLAASMAPTYASLAVLKFLSASCTSSANAAAFVLLGESVPRRYRSRFMFFMATATMVVQLMISLLALPILPLTFRLKVPLLALEYRPWRLLLQVICFPGILGSVFIVFLKESPKFLLCRNREQDSLSVLKLIYSCNSGKTKESYPVETVYLDDLIQDASTNKSFLRKMWKQTAPLFKPPLLKNSMKLYYLLLCAYMTSTGYSMWVPTLSNAYFTGEDMSGMTFCEVASQSVATTNTTATDCDNTIQPKALYATMVYSASCGIFTIFLSCIVGYFGKKATTLFIFSVSIISGVLLLLIRIPLLSIAMFYSFLYVSIILGNVNTYLVELNPTHLRGMATCLSVVVARGFGFFSVQLIGAVMGSHCTPMVSGYVVLIVSGLLVALFLPADNKDEKLANADFTNEIESETTRENGNPNNKA